MLSGRLTSNGAVTETYLLYTHKAKPNRSAFNCWTVLCFLISTFNDLKSAAGDLINLSLFTSETFLSNNGEEFTEEGDAGVTGEESELEAEVETSKGGDRLCNSTEWR